MQTVIIVIHLMIVIALVVVVLLQRSEGGALGMGGGGGGGGGAGGLFTARGSANLLTRTTAFLAVAFFATSIALTVIARQADRPGDLIDRAATTSTTPSGSTTPTTGGATDTKATEPKTSGPTVPSSE